MHRQGHTGIVLLVLAPVLYILLEIGRPFLALLACSVFWIEPLPDLDLRTSLLTHRKASHSLLAAVVVGLGCALIGWLVGTYVTEPLAGSLNGLSTTSLGSVEGVTWLFDRVAALDAGTLAVAGAGIGAGGIVLHLAGDIITVSGIQPLLPFSRWRISLTPLRAKSTVVNTLLFLAGAMAIGAVILFLSGLASQ